MEQDKKDISWEEIVAKNKIAWEKLLKKMYPDAVVMKPDNCQQYITDRINRNIVESNIKNAIDFYKWAKENRHLEYLNGHHRFESRQLTAEEMYELYEESIGIKKEDKLL